MEASATGQSSDLRTSNLLLYFQSIYFKLSSLLRRLYTLAVVGSFDVSMVPFIVVIISSSLFSWMHSFFSQLWDEIHNFVHYCMH